MRVTINVMVSMGQGWSDDDRVHKEIEVNLEHTDNPDLPWGELCAGFVEFAIQERLAAQTEKKEA